MKNSILIFLVVGLLSCSEEDQNNPSQSTLDPFVTETGGICGTADQSYHDVATMDVHVKNDEVTISNWEDQPPTASPISTNFFDCTMTCDPGSVGRFNITSGSGEVFPKPQVGPRCFGLKLNHTALNTDAFTKLVCPDADPIVDNAAPFDFTDEMELRFGRFSPIANATRWAIWTLRDANTQITSTRLIPGI